MPETLTDSIRRRLREHAGTCPTCGQPNGMSLRKLGDATGVPFTVLARFLKGGDMMGRNLDLVDHWLSQPADNTPDAVKAAMHAGAHTGPVYGHPADNEAAE